MKKQRADQQDMSASQLKMANGSTDDLYIPADTEEELEFEPITFDNVTSEDNKKKPSAKGNKTTLEEHLRLLHVYFRDLEHESSLLTANEEIRIAANIKKCQLKAKALKVLSNKTDIYIDRINSLSNAYMKRSIELKKRFIKSNLKLVTSIAKNYTGRGLPLADLIQEGNLGLIRAVDKYDHTLGYKFSTYAVWWIQQAVFRAPFEKSKTIRIPVYLYEWSKKVKTARLKLQKELGHDPEPEEISKELGISPSIVRRVIQAGSEASHVHSLDSPVSSQDDRPQIDLVEDTNSHSQDSAIMLQALKNKMDDIFSLMNEREQEIIKMRFGIDIDTTYTLNEIGAKYGVTRERIRQIEKEALTKVASSDLGDYLKGLI